MKQYLEIHYLKYVGILAYPLLNIEYFPRERKTVVLVKRPDATLCIEFNDERSHQILWYDILMLCKFKNRNRDGSRTAATSKMERFVIVNGFQPLTIITKRSILDVAAVLDPPL